MALPAANSVVYYNGFTFPTNTVTTFTETPVMAQDGRMVAYSQVDITVKGYIGNDLTGFTGGSSGTTATGVAVVTGDMVTSITITSGGSGYVDAPGVTIGPPLAGAIPATATCTVTGGVVTSVTIVNQATGTASPAAAHRPSRSGLPHRAAPARTLRPRTPTSRTCASP
jgi:hypothetical protein